MKRRLTLLAAAVALVAGCTEDSGQPEPPAEASTLTAPPGTSVEAQDVPITCEEGGRYGVPASSATFEIALPTGRRVRNEGNNEWVVSVAPGRPVRLEVTAAVEPGVILASLNYEVDGPGNRTVHRVEAGDEIADVLTTTIIWDGRYDGEQVDRGRYHLFAEAVIGHDGRDPCASSTGAQERWGLGYLGLP